MHWLHWNRIFLSLFLISIASQLADAADGPRDVLKRIGIRPQVGNQIPLDASFINHDGEPITLGQAVDGKPTVLCLVYFSCPMLCNLTSDGLVKSVIDVPAEVGKDFNVVMISFDPRDKPVQAAAARKTALTRYDRVGAENGWYLLTANQASIDTITQAVGFDYHWDETLQQFAHPAGLVVISPQGKITGYLDGVQYSSSNLGEQLQAAAMGKSQTEPPQTFMRCYLYDPTTGKFGAAVQWTVRAFGLLTVLAMAIGITKMMLRKDKKDNPIQNSDG